MAGPYLNIGTFKTKIDANDSTQQEELGTWRFEAGKIFTYFKAGDLIPAREAVKIDTSVAAGTQVLQTSSVTDMFAGIAETTLAKSNFGWITRFGPATARVVSATIPGSGLAPGNQTGVLTIANSSHYNAAAVCVQSGLSAGSAVYITVL